ncbi:MAG: hypothetical protein HFG20_07345 [Anaerotruncus sp.]|nr:hypothetical protein [Anaerotruncus sp.]
MQQILSILQQQWQLVVILTGVLLILGGIFGWKWLWDPTGNRPFGLHAFAYRHFGEKGARVFLCLNGAILILCGIVLWVLA